MTEGCIRFAESGSPGSQVMAASHAAASHPSGGSEGTASSSGGSGRRYEPWLEGGEVPRVNCGDPAGFQNALSYIARHVPVVMENLGLMPAATPASEFRSPGLTGPEITQKRDDGPVMLVLAGYKAGDFVRVGLRKFASGFSVLGEALNCAGPRRRIEDEEFFIDSDFERRTARRCAEAAQQELLSSSAPGGASAEPIVAAAVAS
ncbi:unnamed protein product [Polarella glacialis]|uniref:Uncharacterized protein n=1 Tax=Polarella glacialis TaxID=89957 RepID=A0A813LX63_POLGL|nr:unnamed protein product [Polarella glacialis]